jgi:hypothetical protein
VLQGKYFLPYLLILRSGILTQVISLLEGNKKRNKENEEKKKERKKGGPARRFLEPCC